MFSNKTLFVLAVLVVATVVFAEDPFEGEGSINGPISVNVSWAQPNGRYEGWIATGFTGGVANADHFVCTTAINTNLVTDLFCPDDETRNYGDYIKFETDENGDKDMDLFVFCTQEVIPYAFSMEVWYDDDDDDEFDKDYDILCDVEAFCSTY